jgi:hypothetical protein
LKNPIDSAIFGAINFYKRNQLKFIDNSSRYIHKRPWEIKQEVAWSAKGQPFA